MAMFVVGRKSAQNGGGRLWRYLLIHEAQSQFVVNGGAESRSSMT